MPEQASTRTFSEEEHVAILADRVATETASLTEQVAAKDREIADLRAQLDVAESARAAADAEREKAQSDLADFKKQIEDEREMAARKDERIAKVKEVAAHLTDEFFTDERVARIVAMDQSAFEGYVQDMASVAVVPPANAGAPRETAGLQGEPVTPPATKSAAAAFFFRHAEGGQ